MFGFSGCLHQFFPRVTDAWQPGIADHGNAVAVSQFLEQLGDAGVRVVLVKAATSGLGTQGSEQLAAMAGVFTGDRVHRDQQSPGARGEISQVSDRRADHIEHSGFRFGALLHNGSTKPSP